jgi:hypothetical protein
MYRLCYIPTGWNTPESQRGIKHSSKFDSLEALKTTMSKCIYNGEWVEDKNGNKVDINLRYICSKEIY